LTVCCRLWYTTQNQCTNFTFPPEIKYLYIIVYLYNSGTRKNSIVMESWVIIFSFFNFTFKARINKTEYIPPPPSRRRPCVLIYIANTYNFDVKILIRVMHVVLNYHLNSKHVIWELNMFTYLHIYLILSCFMSVNKNMRALFYVILYGFIKKYKLIFCTQTFFIMFYRLLFFII